MGQEQEQVEIECMIQSEREKAVAVTDGTEEDHEYNGKVTKRLKWFWLPKSQIALVPNGKNWIVKMPEWLAKEKGLI
jgi:hypothetical protein